MIAAKLSLKSLAHRKSTALLTIASIALSVFLLLGVEKLRSGIRQSFLQSISGTDLVVGPRTSGTQLLLYTVFNIGNAVNNVSLKSLKLLEQQPEVKWLVPISLGDSHRGFRVIGTVGSYFEHITNSAGRALRFDAGRHFTGELEVVLGAQVARKYHYNVGDKLVLGHGLGAVSFIRHDREQFSITGILEATGLPLDKTLLVSLRSLAKMHHQWQPGQIPDANPAQPPGSDEEKTGEPTMVSAAFVKLRSKIAILGFQRLVNQFAGEPLTAVIPGVAFAEIWQLVSRVQSTLLVVAALVALTAIVGMVVTLLSSLNERRREMAILRSIGAQPATILWLFVSEAIILTGLAMFIGVSSLYGALWLFQEKLTIWAGIFVPVGSPGTREVALAGIIFATALIGAIIPAIRAYRLSLSDGLTMRH